MTDVDMEGDTRLSAVSRRDALTRTGVVEQDAHGRRGGVVELAGAHGPDERGRETAGHDAAGGDEQDDDAHAGSLRRGADQRISPALSATIVSELTGIRMAVASGVSRAGQRQRQPDDVVDDRHGEAERR